MTDELKTGEGNKCERCGATRWGSVGDMQKAVKAHNERCESLKREGYLAALGDVERELETTIEESGFMVDESDKGYTIKLCEWLKKNLSKLKSRAGEEEPK